MSKLVDWQLTIPGVELRSLNRDLRGTTTGARMAAASRARNQRTGVASMCLSRFGQAPQLPLVITITRVGPRELDGDNLQGACKHVRDGISDWLGVNDRSKLLKWEYSQARGIYGEYGVEVHVQTWRQTFAEYLLANKEYQTLHSSCLKLAAAWMDWVNHEVEPPTPAMISAKRKWERLATKRDKLMEELRVEWEAQNVLCI